MIDTPCIALHVLANVIAFLNFNAIHLFHCIDKSHQQVIILVRKCNLLWSAWESFIFYEDSGEMILLMAFLVL